MCEQPNESVAVDRYILCRLTRGWLTPENVRWLWNTLVDSHDDTAGILARKMNVPYRKFWPNTDDNLLELLSDVMETFPDANSQRTFASMLCKNSFTHYECNDTHFYVMTVPREGLPDEIISFGNNGKIYGAILEIVLRSYAGRPADEVSDIIRRGDK